jgi:ribonuclease HI
MSKVVTIYTDGACRGNPGPGGWGVLLESGDRQLTLYGGEDPTTNNRMELTAVIRALEALKMKCHIELYTDSKYVLQGITEWLPNWKKRNWLTASKKPVQNVDLWQALDKLVSQNEINWHWVKGHSGDRGNEIADQLANKGIDEL